MFYHRKPHKSDTFNVEAVDLHGEFNLLGRVLSENLNITYIVVGTNMLFQYGLKRILEVHLAFTFHSALASASRLD